MKQIQGGMLKAPCSMTLYCFRILDLYDALLQFTYGSFLEDVVCYILRLQKKKNPSFQVFMKFTSFFSTARKILVFTHLLAYL